MKIVAYSYFFALDFLINILYTILFALIWFLIVSDSESTPAPGSKIFDSLKSTAGFEYTDVANSHIIATPNPNPMIGQHASLVGETGIATDPGSAGSMFSVMSIFVFWLIKIYFIIIIFSYARGLVVGSDLTSTSFSLGSNPWEKAQRWMISGNYWREEEKDYKQSTRRL
jgi:Inositolphosphorylceramide synthase subunit Kei1